MPFADSFLQKKQNPFTKEHSDGTKDLRGEEAAQRSWRDRQKDLALNPSFISPDL